MLFLANKELHFLLVLVFFLFIFSVAYKLEINFDQLFLRIVVCTCLYVIFRQVELGNGFMGVEKQTIGGSLGYDNPSGNRISRMKYISSGFVLKWRSSTT